MVEGDYSTMAMANEMVIVEKQETIKGNCIYNNLYVKAPHICQNISRLTLEL